MGRTNVALSPENIKGLQEICKAVEQEFPGSKCSYNDAITRLLRIAKKRCPYYDTEELKCKKEAK